MPLANSIVTGSHHNDTNNLLIIDLLDELDVQDQKFETLMRKFTYGKEVMNAIDGSPITIRR